MTTDIDDDEIKRQVVDKLLGKNSDLTAADVQPIVDEEFAALADRPIRDYLSVLTERAVKKRLKKSK
jgi:hypothetical protein